jgi:hypothetical protein
MDHILKVGTCIEFFDCEYTQDARTDMSPLQLRYLHNRITVLAAAHTGNVHCIAIAGRGKYTVPNARRVCANGQVQGPVVTGIFTRVAESERGAHVENERRLDVPEVDAAPFLSNCLVSGHCCHSHARTAIDRRVMHCHPDSDPSDTQSTPLPFTAPAYLFDKRQEGQTPHVRHQRGGDTYAIFFLIVFQDATHGPFGGT